MIQRFRYLTKFAPKEYSDLLEILNSNVPGFRVIDLSPHDKIYLWQEFAKEKNIHHEPCDRETFKMFGEWIFERVDEYGKTKNVPR